jgi:LEA14-like dessication related protein
MLFQHKDPPQVTLVGMDSAPSEGLEARMQVKLRVQNPNETPIDYNGVYVEIDVQGHSLGTGVSSQTGTVPAFGENVIGVPVSVSFLGIAGEALGMLTGKSLDKITYELRGKLVSPTSGSVPFKSQGELNVADLMSGSK